MKTNEPMFIQTGLRIVYGVPKSIKPIVCNVEGRQRLRLRNTDAARLFVKTPEGIRHFILKDEGDTWTVDLNLEQGRNVRLQN